MHSPACWIQKAGWRMCWFGGWRGGAEAYCTVAHGGFRTDGGDMMRIGGAVGLGLPSRQLGCLVLIWGHFGDLALRLGDA